MAQGPRAAAVRLRMSVVIDTSVVMCILLREPGRERALEVVRGATISSVNIAEVVAKCLERTVSPDLGPLLLTANEVRITDFLPQDGILAGELWSRAPKGVLSLGDRACLATAIRLGATAVTADRAWSGLDLPCQIELIR